jgi:zinc protease
MKLFSTILALIMTFSNIFSQNNFELNIEKYQLNNGLKVILHEDKSDPIVAVTILYHVGSNREKPGKTGFAHLFEHIMFQESQHVGQDQFFKLIQGNGGTLNGGTWQDGTIYFQVVPKNALELVLWLESDRMGFLLPKVTQEAFINQQEVVQNEKRQRVDNQPYGHTNYIINKLLYPDEHPYNWQVIGELVDLQNATVKDVHDFYKKWYGPNNATLVIAGDFDKNEVKKLVEKYFGEIKPSDPVENLLPMPVSLQATKRVHYIDKFAQSPELNIVFPTVNSYTKDSYALDVLANLLSRGKRSPLYKVIVEERKLAPSVAAFQSSSEIAGEFQFRVRAFPNVKLSDVEKAVFDALEKFEKDGFTNEDLERIKARIETSFYNSVASVLGKSYQLAIYNEFTGSPEFYKEDLKNKLDVTVDDVWNVYNKYIKGKNFVLTSFVPVGGEELIAQPSELYIIPEEKLKPFNEEEIALRKQNPDNNIVVEPLPSSFDRSKMPEVKEDPLVNIPAIFTKELKNGIKVFGIEYKELPLVEFQIEIKGGLIQDSKDKVGTANLLARMLMQGTKNKTPIELENAIEELGASVNVYATSEAIVLQGNCLASKYDKLISLVEEILFEPRWDEKEFDRLKKETLESIRRSKSNPSVTATNTFIKLIYGDDNILSNPVIGNQETVSSITIEDLKDYYQNNFAPNISSFLFVGNLTQEVVLNSLKNIESKWTQKNVIIPEVSQPKMPVRAQVYFIDFPDAKQSEIRIGHIGPSLKDEDYFKAYVMNYKLGGAFNGIVNMILREEKGYTYGARTGFDGTSTTGYFLASSAVQSNATLESVQIFKDEISKYKSGITQEDVDFTKNALLKSNALRFETISALRGMLSQIARYDYPLDFIKKQETVLQNMSVGKMKTLARYYLHPDKMIYLVVGDAKTQMERLKDLGFGDPILLNKDGNRVN